MGPHTNGGADVRAALDAFRHIVHALRRSSRQAEQAAGLSGAQLFVLQTLAETPGLSINDLAARTHTHQSSVSTVVARLVERGLIRRQRAADDARRVVLSIVPRAVRIGAKAPDLAQHRLIAAIEALAPPRRRQLAATLGELARAVDATGRPPRMFFEERGVARKARDARG